MVASFGGRVRAGILALASPGSGDSSNTEEFIGSFLTGAATSASLSQCVADQRCGARGGDR